MAPITPQQSPSPYLALRSLLSPDILFSHPESQSQHLQSRSLHIPNFNELLSRSPALSPPADPKPSPTTKRFTLTQRQAPPVDSSVIPSTYTNINKGPGAGTVVGIVFGSVAGFLLLLWIIQTITNFGGGGGSVISEEEVVSSSRRRASSHHRHSRSRSIRRATTTIARSPSPQTAASRSEVIEVQETRRERSRTRTPPRRESRRETIIIEESSRPPQDEIVEVIEEHSPPPPRRHRQSGYRTVDPEAFGGGDRPLRKVSRR